MTKLLVTLSGLLIAVNLFGQQAKVDAPDCKCPSCIAKYEGNVLPFTMPGLQGLNAGLKNGVLPEPEEHTDNEHAGCDHDDVTPQKASTNDQYATRKVTQTKSVPISERHSEAQRASSQNILGQLRNHESESDKHEGHDHEPHVEDVSHDAHIGCTDDHQEDAGHEGHDHEAHVEDVNHDEHISCTDDPQEGAGHEGHDHDANVEEDAGIKISSEMIEKMGIKVNNASGGIVSTTVVFPAEIKLNRDRSSAISARYSSVVRQVFIEIGDEVKKGDLLASLENRQTMAVYSIAAPIDGVVVTKSTSVGEAAGEEKVLFEVADLSTVWADISIFPRFRHKIKSDIPVEFIAHDGHVALGNLKYISPLISQETRTYTARCILEGNSEDFAPGAFVRAKITTDTTNVNVRVERDAVQVVGREQMVFIVKQDSFESRVVQIGVGDANFVEITNGLELGETYVAGGAFTLKSVMVTSGLDPHAGHGH